MLKFLKSLWQQLTCQHLWFPRQPDYWEAMDRNAHIRVYHKCAHCGAKRRDLWPWHPVNTYKREE